MVLSKNCNLGYVDSVQVCFNKNTTICKRLYNGEFAENYTTHNEHTEGRS